jgi:hypothetical protein
MMWARSSTVTFAVAVTMMDLAFQTIAFTLVLEKRTWRNGHRCAGLSFPFPFPFSLPVPVPVPVPVSISLAFTVPVYRPGGKGRSRQRSRSGRG